MKHGLAFGDHIKTEKIKRRRYDDAPPLLRTRGFLMPAIMVVVTLVLLFKIFSLQIIHGSDYRQLADSNRIRTQIIHAPRGVISDRHGTPLVFNVPGFRQIIKDASASAGEEKSVPITKEQALALIAKGAQDIEVDSLRQYPYKDAMSHVLGYTGQINKEDLETPEFADYQARDWIGKDGIERQYEHLLRGKDGKQLIEVDAMGKKVRSLGTTDPLPGQDISLTIDAKLQQAVYDAAKDVQKGTIIVSTPDGQILAMVSKPSFDPNLFTLDASYRVASTSSYTKLASVLLDGQNYPLLNRAVGGVYPPGSTFKMITAAAGLENKLIDKGYRVKDTGVLKVGEFSYANWYFTQHGKTDGEVDVVKALARSNDIFFYKLAELVNVERLSAMAREFGVGQKLGIDLVGEARGLIPSQEWKKKEIGEGWYLGDTFHYGIGQGYLLTTPLQVNAWTQAIANGGTLYQPRFFKDKASRVLQKELLSDETVRLLHEGMKASCAPGGVAFPLYHFKVQNAKLPIDGKDILKAASSSADMREIPIACKTGTSQHGGEKTLPHSWITAFAPVTKPQVVVTVLSESSGEGSQVAAPIAKKVFEAYFRNK